MWVWCGHLVSEREVALFWMSSQTGQLTAELSKCLCPSTPKAIAPTAMQAEWLCDRPHVRKVITPLHWRSMPTKTLTTLRSWLPRLDTQRLLIKALLCSQMQATMKVTVQGAEIRLQGSCMGIACCCLMYTCLLLVVTRSPAGKASCCSTAHRLDRVACSVLQGSSQHDEFDLSSLKLRSNSSCWKDPCKTEQATLSDRCIVLC